MMNRMWNGPDFPTSKLILFKRRLFHFRSEKFMRRNKNNLLKLYEN